MNDFLAKIGGRKLGVMVALALDGRAAMFIACFGQYCRQLRQPIQFVPMLALPLTMLIFPRGQSLAHWPQPTQLSVTVIFAAFLPESIGHAFASRAFTGSTAASAEVLDIENVVRDLRRQLLGARLCLLRIERGQHQIVRHEPYAGALVGYARPVIQRHDVMDLRHAHAGVTGIAHDAESVALGVDAQLGDKLLHIAGRPPA